jgi:hypothetical protein
LGTRLSPLDSSQQDAAFRNAALTGRYGKRESGASKLSCFRRR